MTYIQHYDAPLGRILLAADEVGMTGLWFDGANICRRTARRAYRTGNAGPFRGQALAGPLLCGAGAGLSAAAAPGWLGVSAGGVGAAAANSLRADRDLR